MINGWMDKWMNFERWMAGWLDGWMDGKGREEGKDTWEARLRQNACNNKTASTLRRGETDKTEKRRKQMRRRGECRE